MSALAAFPGDDPVWNTGAANRATPAGAKQILGFVVGEEPSSAYMNWWMAHVGEYVQHYKTAIAQMSSEKLDRDGTTTITGVITPDGDNTRALGSTASRFAMVHAYLLGAGVSVYIPGGRKGIQVSDGLGAAATLYMMSDAKTSGNFIPLVDSVDTLGSNLLRWSHIYTDEITCTDLATANAFVPAYVGTATESQAGVLTQRNIIKAWGTFSTDGIGGITLIDGYNVTSITLGSGGAGTRRALVTVGANFSTANYCVVPSYGGGTADRQVSSSGKLVGSFELRVDGGGAVLGFDNNATLVDFVAFGLQ